MWKPDFWTTGRNKNSMMELNDFETLDVAYEFNDEKEMSSAQEGLHSTVAEASSNVYRALIAPRIESEKKKL